VYDLDSINILRMVPLPLLEGERVASRMISLPFVFMLIFAVIYFQDWLDQSPRSAPLRYLVISSAVIIGLNDLWQNYRIWRVAEAAGSFDERIFDPRAWKVINHPDPTYLGLILAGAVLSLVSLGVLLIFAWRSRRADQGHSTS
jgi:protein-S-isoprenylcysteine O-methyltransferase Ste14